MKTLVFSTLSALVLSAGLAQAITADLSGITPNLTFPEPVTQTTIGPVTRDAVEADK